MNSNSKSQYLDVLQIFRGIAALMVVVHHSIGSIKYYHKIDSSFLSLVGAIGKYGVDFFFVLSGFIIAYTAYYKYDAPNAFSDYVKSRLIRIYVPYLPIGVFMLLLYSFFPSLSHGNRDLSVLTSLTLIPHGNPALSVAWTLSFELCFYMLFSLSFFSRKAWNFLVVFWVLSVVVFNYTSLASLAILKTPFLYVLFSPYNIEFVFGFILALFIVKKENGHRSLRRTRKNFRRAGQTHAHVRLTRDAPREPTRRVVDARGRLASARRRGIQSARSLGIQKAWRENFFPWLTSRHGSRRR